MAELTEQDLEMKIFPVMALLEGRCAFDAVRKAKPHDLKRLDDIHARLEKYAAAGDIERYYEQNYTFHEAVQKLAGKFWLQKTVGDLRKFLKFLRGRQLHLPGRLEASLKEYRLLMAAFHHQKPGGRRENHVRPSAGPAGSPGQLRCRGRFPGKRPGREKEVIVSLAGPMTVPGTKAGLLALR